MAEPDASVFDAKAECRNLTTRSGVYRMFGAEGELLYVGKAKNLRNRVSSYFRSRGLTNKTVALVSRIQRFEVMVTHSETEALLLEQTLIKRHRPPYNVMLVDDKGYPYIMISSGDQFPGLYFQRGKRRRDAQYFGPFPSPSAVRESLSMLQKTFRLRQCENSVFSGRSRPCLQYQIQRCKAPCVGLVSAEEYADDQHKTELFLAGRSQELLQNIEHQMDTAAADLQFERAAQLRDQLQLLRKIQEEQHVAGAHGQVDVVAAVFDVTGCCIHLLNVRNGRLVGSRTHHPKPGLSESAEALVEAYLGQHYLGVPGQDIPPEIIVVPGLPVGTEATLAAALSEAIGRKVTLRTQVRGDRARWRDLALTNATEQLAMYITKRQSVVSRFVELEERLRFAEPIQQMECFDISHNQGEATVASCVIFDRDGPARRLYRRFNINDITAGDDYAAMRQALLRRYSRLLKDEVRLPDLVIIDGGKGQLKMAHEVMHELGISQIRLLGIAKGVSRKAGMETLFLDNDKRPLQFPKHAPALHLLQHIRDEAHRFAVAGHRARRDKERGQSLLDAIPGIGNQRRKALLRYFGSGLAVRDAPLAEIAKVEGISRALAQTIYDYLHELQ